MSFVDNIKSDNKTSNFKIRHNDYKSKTLIISAYARLSRDEDKEKKIKSVMDIFDEIIDTNEPSKYLLNSIIDKIVIYNDKTIEFILKGDIKKITKD